MKTGKTWENTLFMGTVHRDLIILWTAMGLNPKEMAFMLGTSHKTVEYHKGILKRRFGLDGTVAITRHAIRYGYLEA